MTAARVAAIAEEISDLRVLSTNRQIALAQLALLAEPDKLERAAAAAKFDGVWRAADASTGAGRAH